MFTIYRISPRGLQFNIEELPNNQCRIRLIGSNKSIVVNHKLEVISAAWYRWQMKGEYIQEAFRFLNDSEREFILTGLTPEQWNEMFPPDDDKGNQIISEYTKYKNSPYDDPRD